MGAADHAGLHAFTVQRRCIRHAPRRDVLPDLLVGFYADPRYGIGFATAPSALGPWTKSLTNPIVSTDRAIGVPGTGHNLITVSPDGSELFMVYTCTPTWPIPRAGEP